MAERIEFKCNVPTVLTLAYAEGRSVKSNYGQGQQLMLSDTSGKVAFVPMLVEPKLKALNPQPGMSITILKTERAGKRGFDWTVSRVGEQQDGTYKIPKADSSPPQVSESASATELTSQASHIASVVPKDTPRTSRVSTGTINTHCRHLAHCLHNLRAYAKQEKLAISPEDAGKILLTVYIQQMQGGEIQR